MVFSERNHCFHGILRIVDLLMVFFENDDLSMMWNQFSVI